MSASRSHADATPGVTARSYSRGGDFVTLMKPRLNFLVLLTTAAAYSLGAGPDSTLVDLVHTLLGTFLVAGGAAALNQVWERQTDRLMRRTQTRPLADMRMTVAQGTTFGLLLTIAGAAELAYFINPLVRDRRAADDGELPLFLHAAEAPHVALDDRRRVAGCAAGGDRLGGRHQHAVARGLGAVRHRVHVADAALPCDRVDVSR